MFDTRDQILNQLRSGDDGRSGTSNEEQETAEGDSHFLALLMFA